MDTDRTDPAGLEPASPSTALTAKPAQGRALATSRVDHFKAYLAQLLDAADSVRAENVDSHLERARLDDAEALNRVQDKPAEFAEWITGVADVDPEDKELSLIWQAALKALATNGTSRKVVMDIAKTMSVDEAAAFIALMDRYWDWEDSGPAIMRTAEWQVLRGRRNVQAAAPIDEEYHLNRLRERGLVRPPWAGLTHLVSGRVFVLFVISAIIVGAPLLVPDLARASRGLVNGALFSSSSQELLEAFYLPIFGVLGLVLLPALATRWLKVPVLTPTGEMFRTAVRRTLERSSEPAEPDQSPPT